MKQSRRGFLENSIVGAVGATALGATACSPTVEPASAPLNTHTPISTNRRFSVSPSAPVRVRKSFWDLTDAEVQTLCKAVGYARNMYLVNDPRKWENYAKIHASHCTGEAGTDPHGVLQVHWSWHFLPWHRGYVFFLERILAQALKDQGLDDTNFAYPFWDWTVHQEMPNTKERVARGLASPLWGYDLTQEDMVSADTLGFDNLALYDGNRGPSLTKSQMSPDNETSADSKAHIREAMSYMSAPYINLALTLPWEQFGGKVDINRTSQGIIESGPHNDGHDWCGTRLGSNRDMGTLKFAAQDPIFFMHHGNIDRIFSLYRGEMPDINGPWGQQTYDYTDVDGSTVTVSVKDIMTTLTNAVHYAVPSDNALVVPTTTRTQTASRLFTVGSGAHVGVASADVPLTVTLETPETSTSETPTSVYLLEITTGPLRRRGRARIDVWSDHRASGRLGRIKLLDGDAHHSTRFVPSTLGNHAWQVDDAQSHTFRVVLNRLPHKDAFVVAIEPRGFDAPIEIRSIELKRFD